MQTRTKSVIRKPKVILSHDTYFVGLEPTSFSQAFKVSKRKEAMPKEFNALVANDTWDLVPSQPIQNLVGCKWDYRVKFNSDGLVERCQAHVAFSNHQQAGISYY